MGDPAIELKGVRKSHGIAPALDGVDLRIGEREFTALIGPSGSGKTTLLKTINRLVEPDGGEVRIRGEDARTLAPHLLRRKIGYVFQEIGLFPHFTVAENIAIGPRLAGWDPDRIAARTAELLHLAALPGDLAGRLPAELSGGQRQRVGLARALAAEPGIMLLDEPFAALDPERRRALGGDYRSLHERLGLTTVMVTHDMAEAVLLADRIVLLEAGRVTAAGTPAELMGEGSHPRVRALLDAPRRQAERLRSRLEARR